MTDAFGTLKRIVGVLENTYIKENSNSAERGSKNEITYYPFSWER